MSNTTWWILAGSIVLGLIVMILAWVWMRWRIKNIKKEYSSDDIKIDDKKIKNIEDRGDAHGILLWDLKKTIKNPLDDFQLEFIINTIVRNEYKTTLVSNGDEYITKTLKKLAKQ